MPEELYDSHDYCLLVDEYCSLAEENESLKTRIAELEAERRWIPVSERLPKEGERVVLYSHGVTAVGWGRYELDIWYWECWDDKWSSWDTPTHWLPLPEPPEVK